MALDACICLARLPRVAELLHGSYHTPRQLWVETLVQLAIPSIILWRMWVYEQKRRQQRAAELAHARRWQDREQSNNHPEAA